MIYKLTLYSCGAPEHCTCEAGYDDETDEFILPVSNACVFTIEAHNAALDRAMERLGAIKQLKESQKTMKKLSFACQEGDHDKCPGHLGVVSIKCECHCHMKERK